MRVVRFKAEHLQRLTLQATQEHFYADFSRPGYPQELERCAAAFTGMADDGEVLACVGVQEIWPERATAWALISANAGPHFRAIHRAVSGYLQQAQWRRLEMLVLHGFEPGHRWARMLGMTHEGVMRAFSPQGEDFSMYARIKNG